MIVYRLCKAKYKSDLSGEGAKVVGGRWNSKGVALLYTGESRALCTAEAAVHMPLGIIPKDYYLMAIEIPDSAIQTLDLGLLQDDWDSLPHSHSTQLLGDAFVVEGKYLALKVPSAVVPGDYNYLINPAHKERSKVIITDTIPYRFDERLFRR